MKRKTTVLVTGGAGFLGSNLCKKLLELGNTVYCFDNFNTGRHINIASLTNNKNFHVIEDDIRNTLNIKVDQIYHLASPASPPKYMADPIYTLETNIIGTSNICKLARKLNARVLLASTSEVYGNPLQHPQNEKYWGNVNQFGPRACYDEAKRVSETYAFEYQQLHGLDIRVARIFNTYGPHMDPADGRVISNFCMQALCGKSLTIYGDGTQTRSFCYVDDLIDGFISLMNVENFDGLPVNLGNPNEFSLINLIEQIEELLKIKVTTTYKPLPCDDPIKRKPDIKRAEELLNWTPKIQLKNGLQRTLKYLKDYT